MRRHQLGPARSIFLGFVDDPEIENLAWNLANELRSGDDPRIHPADVTAARPYLRTCLMRMSEAERSSLTHHSAGALWARGALGAARYRVGQVDAQPTGRARRRDR